MANIPEEVMHLCVLPRLPVKSLVRFKCVSKSWQAVISSPDFIRLHHRHALSSDKNRLLIVYDTPLQRFHLHELDSFPLAPSLLLPYPKPATCTTPMVVDIVASCEFFLLLSCSLRHVLYTRTVVRDRRCGGSRQINKYNRHCDGLPRCNMVEVSGKTYETTTDYYSNFYGLILFNPAAGSYYQIPYQKTPVSHDPIIYGICLDHANDDYKIVRIIQSREFVCTREVMVYSFKTNSWKLIERKLSNPMSNGAVIGPLLHIIFHSVERNIKIRCFDIVAEHWTDDLPLPDQLDSRKHKINLCVLDGLLCVSARGLGMFKYQVWVMKDYGVKESWVKLMNIDYSWYEYHPITYRTGSQHELLCTRRIQSDLCWYNLRDKEANQVEFDGYTSISGHICKGSLVSFPGGQQINE